MRVSRYFPAVPWKEWSSSHNLHLAAKVMREDLQAAQDAREDSARHAAFQSEAAAFRAGHF